MIEPERLTLLNQQEIQAGKYVLYWMQASQRVDYNHALGFAIEQANKLGKPLLVFFGLLPEFPSANERSYAFMLEGIREVSKQVQKKGASFLLQKVAPDQGVIRLARDASMVVVDCDYQREQRLWRKNVAASIRCPLIQVETNVVVPIGTVSNKEEYTAGTLRPKLHRFLDQFLRPYSLENIETTREIPTAPTLETDDIPGVLKRLIVDASVKKVDWLTGGPQKAVNLLRIFIKQKLDGFAEHRNDPTLEYLSNMSPYLHFGQISPIQIALEVLDAESSSEESYLEELIVRRELSMNFAYYNGRYDSIECLPNWARSTLDEHVTDKREYLYNAKDLENYETHDPYWNAAQKQMVSTGKMHGYMRMYWGKKILEWTKAPKEAYEIAIYLNDKYELDGRDPNGYAGIAWCFGKHDRAWSERPIFGKVRYMNDKGLRRKFDIEAYARRYGF